MVAAKRWHKMQRRIEEKGQAAFGVILLFLLFFSRVLSFRLVFILAVVGGLLIWLIVSSMRPYYADRLERVFLVEQRYGQQIVAGVLGQKGLPYERQVDGQRIRFVLSDQAEPLVVHVEPTRLANRSLFKSAPGDACRVSLHPVNAETQPLVESLQAKIDEAFLPRGLPPAAA